MSADLAMDVKTFAKMLADATGLNDRRSRPGTGDRMAGRDAPWDGLARALAEAKLSSA
jgi:hypothetical protein